MARYRRKSHIVKTLCLATVLIVLIVWIYDLSQLNTVIGRDYSAYHLQILRRIPVIEDAENESYTQPLTIEYCNTIINNDPETLPHFLNLNISTSLSNLNEREIKLRHKWPPYLISYGGSGNSYIRLMIEYTTDIYTGAIYNEPEYEKLGFAGLQCKDNVIIVKAHTSHIMDNNVTLKRLFDGECICNCDKRINRKFETMKKLNQYKSLLKQQQNPEILAWMNLSAVFLIRDPWKSAWSTMQMVRGEPINETDPFMNIHTRHLPSWMIPARTMVATMSDYIETEWYQTFELMELFDKNGFEYIVIKLENFISNDVEIARNEWEKLFGFLLNKDYFDRNYKEMYDRWQCAKIVGDNVDRMRLIHRQKKNRSDDGYLRYLTIDNAYDSWSKNRICLGWETIREKAELYDYERWSGGRHKDLDCNEVMESLLNDSDESARKIAHKRLDRLNAEAGKKRHAEAW